MKKEKIAVIALGLSAVMWLTGCDKKNSTQPTTSDQDAMSSLVANDGLFQNDVTILNDGDPTSTPSYAKTLSTQTAITKLIAWGRKIDSFSRTVDFTVLTDSTAQATVTHTLSGFIWIRGKYNPGDTVVQTIKKNFTETLVRLVQFVRINRTNNPENNWKISAISAIKGGTANSQLTITDVKFYAGDDTVEVTDPNSTFLTLAKGKRGCIPELTPDQITPMKVQVTVVSAAPDSDIVSVHRPFYDFRLLRWFYHDPMILHSTTPNGDGTYTRVYEQDWKGVAAGRHTMMVSVITRGTIFDDSTQVSSQIWGVPFIAQ